MYENYKILKTEREVDKLIENCKKTGYCSFDFETSGHEYHSPLGYPTIMGISFQPGSAFIIPLGHFDSVFRDEYQDIFKKISKELLENPKIVKVAWNAKFEYQWVKRLGGQIHGRFFDGMLAKYLLNEERPNDLKSMVMRYIPEYGGYESYEGSKLPWDQKPLEGLSQYCAMDCDMTLRLMIFFENQLIKNDFYKLFRNLLMMGTRVLAESEYMGFDIDKDKLSELDVKYIKLLEESDNRLRNHRKIKKFEKYLIEQRVEKLISKIEIEISEIEEELLDITDPVIIRRKEKSIQTRYDKIDRLNAKEFTTANERKVLEPVNFSSPQQMGELFFTSKKGFRFDIIKYTTDKAKNETENPSTDESVLLELSRLDKSGFCKELLNYRGLSKLYGAFIKGIQERLGHDGKIHARYNLHQTVTGRLSCVHAESELFLKDNKKIKIGEICPHHVGEIDLKHKNLYVLTHKNRYKKITKGINKGKEMMYEVTLDSGEKIQCTLKHIFITPEGERTLEEIYKQYQDGIYCKLLTLK